MMIKVKKERRQLTLCDMTRGILILLIPLLLTGCKPDPSSYKFHDEMVKGPVKQIVERTYSTVKDSAGWKAGRLQQKVILSYSKDKRLAGKQIYGADKTLVEEYRYKYENGVRVEGHRVNQDSTLTHITTYSYPWIYGQVESVSRTPGDSLRWYSTYTFDSEIREVKQKIFGPDDRLNYRVQFRYNQEGFVMQKMGVNEFSYSFKAYDDQGNWTRRLNKMGGGAPTLTKRTISYY